MGGSAAGSARARDGRGAGGGRRSSRALRVGWYRFRATFGRRWGGYLSLILLVGLVGGLAMGSIAGARRTEASFPAFVQSTDPADLAGPISYYQPGGGPFGVGYSPALIRTVTRQPLVTDVEVAVGLNTLRLGPDGTPVSIPGLPAQGGEGAGSVTGFGYTMDRVSVVEGRMPSRRSTDEMAMSRATADRYRLGVGETATFGLYTDAQTYLAGFGTAAVPPVTHVRVRLVGIVVQNSQVVEDDADVATNASLLVFPPALTRQLLGCCAYFTEVGIRVAGGAANAGAVQNELTRALPPGSPPLQANATEAVEAKAERAIEPEAIALGVFGAICALAALLIGAQIIGRQLRLTAGEEGTVRALGGDPAVTILGGLIGIAASVVLGALVAVGVAAGLSPLAPLGPVRSVEPSPPVAFDWAVLGLGVVVLVVVLVGVGLATAFRLAPHRAGWSRRAGGPRSAVAGLASSSALPESAVTGIRFALEPGAGRDAVPVRSAILGTALAVMVVVATVTFGASLTTLVSHPAYYGWNWNYELTASEGADIPSHLISPLLDSDHAVASWSGVYFGTVRIDGRVVPIIAGRPDAAVAPPVLSGHAVEAADQVVLGAQTLAQLHKRVGDTVTVRVLAGSPRTLSIVGTATMPTIDNGGNQHTEMGTGALVASSLLPEPVLLGYGPPDQAGPQGILLRLRPGADPTASLRQLQRFARATSNQFDDGVTVNTVQRPAEIVNYRSMGSTPAVLGAALAAGAVAALALTLVASVRRRRRDLAMFKALGFTRRQLSAVVAWQSSVAVAIGTLIGVPFGIVAGRSLWLLFARDLAVAPHPTVPAVTLALIVVGALVLANLVAALPGQVAARTPTALLLRAE
jgi:hypothetical protein